MCFWHLVFYSVFEKLQKNVKLTNSAYWTLLPITKSLNIIKTATTNDQTIKQGTFLIYFSKKNHITERLVIKVWSYNILEYEFFDIFFVLNLWKNDQKSKMPGKSS